MGSSVSVGQVNLAWVLALLLLMPAAATAEADHAAEDHTIIGTPDEEHGGLDEEARELCGPTTQATSGFVDVAYGSMHGEAIRCMAGYSIIQGRTDGSFMPTDDLARGQMASLLARFIHTSSPTFEATSTHDAHQPPKPFGDTTGSVHLDGIQTLLALGVTTGVSETRFEPLGTVTREQMASFIYRAFQALGVEFAAQYAPAFQDVAPGSTHAGAINALTAEGIITGTGTTTFAPRRSVTREQAAALLHRSAQQLHETGRWGSTWPEGAGSTGAPGTWSDPATWPAGRVPTAADDVIIQGHVTIAGRAEAKTVTVRGGSTLEFASDTSSNLEVSGNVVVEGMLKMEPASHHVEHLLRFVGIDEERFVGGGHAVLETDVGLWFTGHGRAHIDGSERLAWTRAATSLPRGSRTLQLEQAPTGWRTGDEILITPTSPPGTTGHSTGYSGGRITSISGNTVELDTPVAYEHPRVDGRWGAEVMNMTRNVRIEGTSQGRAHIMFSHTHSAQHLRNASLRYMGPRQDTESTIRDRTGSQTVERFVHEGVMGRYPLHFHHNGSGSHGTLVENVTVRDSGHRAFVAHASDGITFRGTLAHDVFDTAYWWDRRTGCCGQHSVWDPPSSNVAYERAIASLVRTDPPFRGYRLAGFELGHGKDVMVRDSVAVGVQGNKNAAGFNWPEGSSRDPETGERTDLNHWTFQRNVSHNNRVNGIFVWQNTNDERHLIENSGLYHNAEHGIDHGAYGNRYRYVGLDIYGNGESGVLLHAQGEMQFRDLVFDGAGISRYAFRTAKHRSDSGPALLIDSEFSGYTDRAIALLASEPTRLDVVNPRFSEAEETWFHLSDDVPPGSVIRVQLSDGTAFRLHPASSSVGTPVAEWNARREQIAPFR